jgi:hypothetical protein
MVPSKTFKMQFKHLQRLAVLGAFALTFCAPSLRADILWNWTYSGTNNSGSGTFTTDSDTSTANSFTGYLITGMSGTFDGSTVDLLTPGSFGSTDNLLAVSVPQFSDFGINFSNTDGDFELWSSGSSYDVFNGFTSSLESGATFSATEAASAPEPAAAILFVPALVILALFSRYRKAHPRTV